jgi:hypothetical protein
LRWVRRVGRKLQTPKVTTIEQSPAMAADEVNKVAAGDAAQNGVAENGVTQNGVAQNGISQNEISQNGVSQNGVAQNRAGVTSNEIHPDHRRKRIVVVGLGMVAVAFMYVYRKIITRLNR